MTVTVASKLILCRRCPGGDDAESSWSSEDGDDREERDRYDGMGLVGKLAALVVVLSEEDVERVDESVSASDINSSSTWP